MPRRPPRAFQVLEVPQAINVLRKEIGGDRDSVSGESRIVYQRSPLDASILIPPFAHANKNDSLNFLVTTTVNFLIPQSNVSSGPRVSQMGHWSPLMPAYTYYCLASISLGRPVQSYQSAYQHLHRERHLSISSTPLAGRPICLTYSSPFPRSLVFSNPRIKPLGCRKTM